MRTAVAITASDIHLSHRCPVARSVEPDWYAVMERQLKELQEIVDEHDAPLLYAGDIFHTYNPPPCLINFAIKHLPKGHAIPGQHDLPHHVYSDMHKTAYGCLVSAGVLRDLRPGKGTILGYVSPSGRSHEGLIVHGFPWGAEFVKNRDPFKKAKEKHVAVVHRYVWQKGSGYVGANIESSVSRIKEIAKTYDFVVFGDNHKGFKNGNIVNNGTFMRRASDETAQPCVSILWSDGWIDRIGLKSTNDDKFVEYSLTTLALLERSLDLSGFVEGLGNLGADKIDYVRALKRYCDTEKVSDNVRATLMEATGE